MHASATVRRQGQARGSLAIVGAAALLLAAPAISAAEESNPNNYNCLGSLARRYARTGSEEQQVNYTFYCNGPITGYQVQSQFPVTGVQSPPMVADHGKDPLADTFSCSGEIPGWAVNCVGAAKAGYENITGQFAIGTKLCAEPRVDPLLTVTYAYLEKGVVTQAISGPYDLGRPKGCRPDAFSGGTRLNPTAPASSHKSSKKHHSRSARARRARGARHTATRRRERARRAARGGKRRPPHTLRSCRARLSGRRRSYTIEVVRRSTSAIEVRPSRTLHSPSSRSRSIPSSTATATMSSTDARSSINARIGSLTPITS